MVSVKASGFLSEQEIGDSAASGHSCMIFSGLLPTLWRAPLLSGIQGKPGANDSLIQGLAVHLRASLQNPCGGLLESFPLGM